MPASTITLITRPKVNLYLHVTGKRDDGYHLLDSLVAFPDIDGDVITCTLADRFQFSMAGPYAVKTGDEENNLVVRAAHAYFNAIGKAAHVSFMLEKNLPVGGGVGGGSSDAATTIRALEHLHGPLPTEQRDRLLLNLGADVPVCYHGAPCRFEGIGEVITNVSTLPPLHMVLVWPGVSSSTPAVFREYKKPFSPRADIPAGFADTKSCFHFLRETDNDLTEAALTLHPVIDEARHIIANQPGCLLARMSGSGACVFGLFTTEDESAKAVAGITANHPDWWIKKGPIR